MAQGVAAALRQHLADDGWVEIERAGGALRFQRDDGLTLRAVVVEHPRVRRRWRRSDRSERALASLLRGMHDPQDLHALALPARDLPTVLTVPGRVWMLLGVRVYAVGRGGSVHLQVV